MTTTEQQPSRFINLYQIYDTEAGCTASPILTEYHDAIITRAFYGALADPKTRYAQHPQHFELRHIGIQYEETGKLHSLPNFAVVATGIQWLKEQLARQEAPNAEPQTPTR